MSWTSALWNNNIVQARRYIYWISGTLCVYFKFQFLSTIDFIQLLWSFGHRCKRGDKVASFQSLVFTPVVCFGLWSRPLHRWYLSVDFFGKVCAIIAFDSFPWLCQCCWFLGAGSTQYCSSFDSSTPTCMGPQALLRFERILRSRSWMGQISEHQKPTLA